MLQRIDHVGIVVDDLDEAKRFLAAIRMELDRTRDFLDRMKTAFYRCGDVQIEVIEISEPGERARRLGEVPGGF